MFQGVQFLISRYLYHHKRESVHAAVIGAIEKAHRLAINGGQVKNRPTYEQVIDLISKWLDNTKVKPKTQVKNDIADIHLSVPQVRNISRKEDYKSKSSGDWSEKNQE